MGKKNRKKGGKGKAKGTNQGKGGTSHQARSKSSGEHSVPSVASNDSTKDSDLKHPPANVLPVSSASNEVVVANGEQFDKKQKLEATVSVEVPVQKVANDRNESSKPVVKDLVATDSLDGQVPLEVVPTSVSIDSGKTGTSAEVDKVAEEAALDQPANAESRTETIQEVPNKVVEEEAKLEKNTSEDMANSALEEPPEVSDKASTSHGEPIQGELVEEVDLKVHSSSEKAAVAAGKKAEEKEAATTVQENLATKESETTSEEVQSEVEEQAAPTGITGAADLKSAAPVAESDAKKSILEDKSQSSPEVSSKASIVSKEPVQEKAAEETDLGAEATIETAGEIKEAVAKAAEAEKPDQEEVAEKTCAPAEEVQTTAVEEEPEAKKSILEDEAQSAPEVSRKATIVPKEPIQKTAVEEADPREDSTIEKVGKVTEMIAQADKPAHEEVAEKACALVTEETTGIVEDKPEAEKSILGDEAKLAHEVFSKASIARAAEAEKPAQEEVAEKACAPVEEEPTSAVEDEQEAKKTILEDETQSAPEASGKESIASEEPFQEKTTEEVDLGLESTIEKIGEATETVAKAAEAEKPGQEDVAQVTEKGAPVAEEPTSAMEDESEAKKTLEEQTQSAPEALSKTSIVSKEPVQKKATEEVEHLVDFPIEKAGEIAETVAKVFKEPDDEKAAEEADPLVDSTIKKVGEVSEMVAEAAEAEKPAQEQVAEKACSPVVAEPTSAVEDELEAGKNILEEETQSAPEASSKASLVLNEPVQEKATEQVDHGVDSKMEKVDEVTETVAMTAEAEKLAQEEVAEKACAPGAEETTSTVEDKPQAEKTILEDEAQSASEILSKASIVPKEPVEKKAAEDGDQRVDWNVQKACEKAESVAEAAKAEKLARGEVAEKACASLAGEPTSTLEIEPEAKNTVLGDEAPKVSSPAIIVSDDLVTEKAVGEVSEMVAQAAEAEKPAQERVAEKACAPVVAEPTSAVEELEAGKNILEEETQSAPEASSKASFVSKQPVQEKAAEKVDHGVDSKMEKVGEVTETVAMAAEAEKLAQEEVAEKAFASRAEETTSTVEDEPQSASEILSKASIVPTEPVGEKAAEDGDQGADSNVQKAGEITESVAKAAEAEKPAHGESPKKECASLAAEQTSTVEDEPEAENTVLGDEAPKVSSPATIVSEEPVPEKAKEEGNPFVDSTTVKVGEVTEMVAKAAEAEKPAQEEVAEKACAPVAAELTGAEEDELEAGETSLEEEKQRASEASSKASVVPKEPVQEKAAEEVDPDVNSIIEQVGKTTETVSEADNFAQEEVAEQGCDLVTEVPTSSVENTLEAEKSIFEAEKPAQEQVAEKACAPMAGEATSAVEDEPEAEKSILEKEPQSAPEAFSKSSIVSKEPVQEKVAEQGDPSVNLSIKKVGPVAETVAKEAGTEKPAQEEVAEKAYALVAEDPTSAVEEEPQAKKTILEDEALSAPEVFSKASIVSKEPIEEKAAEEGDQGVDSTAEKAGEKTETVAKAAEAEKPAQKEVVDESCAPVAEEPISTVEDDPEAEKTVLEDEATKVSNPGIIVSEDPTQQKAEEEGNPAVVSTTVKVGEATEMVAKAAEAEKPTQEEVTEKACASVAAQQISAVEDIALTEPAPDEARQNDCVCSCSLM